MEKETKDIFQTIVSQAQKGVVKIGSEENGLWKYYTRFYSKIDGVSNATSMAYPLLEIPNADLMVKLIDLYLKNAEKFYCKDKEYYDLDEYDFRKKLLLDLIINADYYDFSSFFNYVTNRTEMLKNELLEGEFLLGNFEDLKIFANISKNRSNLESPYRFDIFFRDKIGNEFMLPSILFAQTNKKCFIMAVQNFNKAPQNCLSKKLDRYFRKANKDVDMTDVLGKISPNALISLTLFNSYLQQNNIKEIVSSCFFPIRYHACKISGYKKSSDKQSKNDFLQRHNQNQYNMTNKFLYLFLRYKFHFDNAETFFDVKTQKMKMFFTKPTPSPTDNILYRLSKSVKINQKDMEKA